MFKATFDFNKKKIDAEYTLDKKEVQADFNLNIIPSISHLATKEELEKAADKHFEFEQGIASDVWVIEHNMDKFPSVFVVDSAGIAQMPNEIEYNNENKITLYFLSPFAGNAYLN